MKSAVKLEMIDEVVSPSFDMTIVTMLGQEKHCKAKGNFSMQLLTRSSIFIQSSSAHNSNAVILYAVKIFGKFRKLFYFLFLYAFQLCKILELPWLIRRLLVIWNGELIYQESDICFGCREAKPLTLKLNLYNRFFEKMHWCSRNNQSFHVLPEAFSK